MNGRIGRSRGNDLELIERGAQYHFEEKAQYLDNHSPNVKSARDS